MLVFSRTVEIEASGARLGIPYAASKFALGGFSEGLRAGPPRMASLCPSYARCGS